jgi:predicted Ser/Thr protein kinase
MKVRNAPDGAPSAHISDQEFKFLLGSRLFQSTSPDARKCLRAALRPKQIGAGDRLIQQGDPGDELYLIQSGSCIVNFDRDGRNHQVCRLKETDLVGEMAVLTGENRIANVDAETDLLVWGITREAFDDACAKCPELLSYLSEIITYRFSSQKATSNRKIGRYEIKRIIGKGGWSVVYGGVHSFLNLPVAIKMLKHDMALDPDFLEKFQNEARIVAGLNHHNIVRVYDIEHIYRTVFIVMEYLEGESLRSLMDSSAGLPLSKLLEFLVQTAKGLEYAHAQGIVHQDIKPANLFLTNGDILKILDFGLACHPEEEQTEWEGTIHYMSPEQIEGDPIDERTDIYSLGITAFEMAVGRLPFAHSDVSMIMDAHVNEALPDPCELNPALPAELGEIIVRATEKDPANRFSSASDMLRFLLPLSAKYGAKPPEENQESKKIMNLALRYESGQQLEMNTLLEGLVQDLKKLGVEVHVGSMDRL